MRERRLAWALALLALAAFAWWSARSRWSQPAARRPLAGVDAAALVRLERESGGRTLTLAKKAGRWTADGSPADSARCDALARGAQALTLTGRVDADAERYPDYGLGDDQAVRLRAWAEGAAAPALDVYLGRPAYGGVVYARLADEAQVRLAQGLPLDELSLPATGFLLR